MDLSIIIVNFNTKNLLDRCIRSIINSKPSVNYEIIVVDNHSAYNVVKQIGLIKNQFPNIEFEITVNKNNIGYGRANNIGVRKAHGTYILFLNTDIEVINSSITDLYSYIKTQKKDVIAGGKLLNSDLTDQPSCGRFYSPINAFVMLFLKGDRLGLTKYSSDKIKKVDWVSGSCFIIKKEIFSKLGGFDENIFMYMEEVELMYRARQNNIETYFYPKARFIHLGAATSKSHMDPIINIYTGLTYFYKKHYNRTSQTLLRTFLMIKAYVSYIIGRIFGKSDLTETYRKALHNI